jgi:hypothetical protein
LRTFDNNNMIWDHNFMVNGRSYFKSRKLWQTRCK